MILTEQSDEEGRPGPIEATLSYATDLFDPDTVAALAERYLRILEAVSVDPAVGSATSTSSSTASANSSSTSGTPPRTRCRTRR